MSTHEELHVPTINTGKKSLMMAFGVYDGIELKEEMTIDEMIAQIVGYIENLNAE